MRRPCQELECLQIQDHDLLSISGISLPTRPLGDLLGLLERVLDRHHAVLLLADHAVVLGPEHKVQLLGGQQGVQPIVKL